MFITCTNETSFRVTEGEVYQQIDDVSMGNLFVQLYANFCMCFIENKVVPSMKKTPIV